MKLLLLSLAAAWSCEAFQGFSTPSSSKRLGRGPPSSPFSPRSTKPPAPSIPRQRLSGDKASGTRLDASAPVFAASSALSAVSKTLALVTTSVVAFMRLVTKDFKALSPRQWAWWVLTLAAGYALGRMPPFWVRYTNVMDIPRGLYGQTLWGHAVAVSDGDTIRFLHQPTRWHPKALKKGEKASVLALPVRICTIDTPETPKFGKPGQPFGLEAKEELKGLLEGKRIGMRLLQTDQYGRAVAQVFAPSSRLMMIGKPIMVDEFMLGKGMAEVYTGGGAVYGPLGLDAYLGLQEEAQKQKIGIWSQKKRESAAEYKKRTKE